MFNKLSEKTKGVLALVSLTVIYGGVGVMTRYLNLHFPILQQIYLRLFLQYYWDLFFLEIKYIRKSFSK